MIFYNDLTEDCPNCRKLIYEKKTYEFVVLYNLLSSGAILHHSSYNKKVYIFNIFI